MKSKLLIAACVMSAVGTLEVIHSPVAEAQLVQTGQCQTAFAFQTNNDFGDCVPVFYINTNPPAPMQVYARRADVQLARSAAQYNSAFAANYAQWVAKNGDNGAQVAASSIQCLANTSGPAAALCQPQTVTSHKPGGQVARR